MNFLMTSPAFRDGSPIPRRHAVEGDNLSPPLEWRNPPPETRSFVLVVDDPDAPNGTFHHWAVHDIPAGRDRLPEGLDQESGGGSFGFGRNDFGNARWDGPHPPPGHGRHHYHFRLAALSTDRLDVPAGASVAEIWRAAQPHIIGQAELVGTYER